MENAKYDVIIVGGGPIGLWASYYAGFRGMKSLLLEASDVLGGQAIYLYPEKVITDLPGIPAITGKQLVDNLLVQMKSISSEYLLQAKVSAIVSSNGNKVVVTDKGSFEGSYVLLTPGVGNFVPNKLGNPKVEAFEGRGVYYFVKRKEDFKNKRVLIVGGGDSAVDWSLELAGIADKVYLVHRRNEFRAAASNVNRAVQLGVSVITPYTLESLMGNGAVEKAVLRSLNDSSELTLDVDAVLLMLGYKIDLSTVKSLNLELGQDGVLIDVNCVTSDPRILAAGDIATPRGGIKQKLLVVGFAQATTAINYINKMLRPSSPTFVHSTVITSDKSN